jgi:hypothetical protein
LSSVVLNLACCSAQVICRRNPFFFYMVFALGSMLMFGYGIYIFGKQQL